MTLSDRARPSIAKARASVHPDCSDFVVAIEELLERRRRDAARIPGELTSWRHDDWGPRTWSRTEFEDMVYASYKPMRQGRVTRPPRPETVMDIADYLNCTLEERNRLLLAAHATPVAPYLTGEKLQEVLNVAVEVARGLPVPAVIINRDWRIHFINTYALTLNGITPAQVAAIPPAQLNILQLLFDPNLPLHPHLSQNRASWTRMARQSIYGFKMANLLCQFEPWYQALILQLMVLPEFEQLWHSVSVDVAFDGMPRTFPPSASVVVETAVPNRPQRARLRPVLISVGYFQFDFPQIVALFPADQPSRDVLQGIGIPVPDLLPTPYQ